MNANDEAAHHPSAQGDGGRPAETSADRETGKRADFGDGFSKTDAELLALREAGDRAATDLASFLDRSPSPFHAAAEVARRLSEKGFSPLDEREAWALEPGERRYVIRGGSTILAFIVGDSPPAEAGFRIIGAHTDSPNLRVKPNADGSKSGYQLLGVEVYGGVLLSTWLDRDLSIAGRVFVDVGGAVEARTVDLQAPVARVSNLAIHLNRGVNTDGLVLNPQKHMVPMVGLGKAPALKKMIARALGEREARLISYDLCLYDTARAQIGGAEREFIFSGRLDNLASCHAATTALLDGPARAPATRVVVFYDHEECGSRSAIGAQGTVVKDTLARIIEAYGRREGRGAIGFESLTRAMRSSILVSSDMAHGVHPNYDSHHDSHHAPVLNRGLVIKHNNNQSYATDGETAARVVAWANACGYAPQRFVVRTDLPCGSTIGPITAAALGIPTVDVGAPMLSMHSCREVAGTLDVHLSIETFKRALTA